MHYYLAPPQPTKGWRWQRRLGWLCLLIFLGLLVKIWIPYTTALARASAIRWLPPEWTTQYVSASLPAPGQIPIGNRLIIPSLGVNAPIIEGVGDAELLRGVGHDPASSLPGKQGRTVVSGHRFTPKASPWSTVFFSLDKLKVGESLTLFYNGQRYTYRITKGFDVPKDKLPEELAPVTAPVLTLYTCGPTPYSTKHRIGWHAVLDESERKETGTEVITTLHEGLL